MTGELLGSLLHEPDVHAGPPEEHVPDLLLPGGLDEASLLDVCHSVLWSSCGLLLDARAAAISCKGNTVLLVVRRVTSTSVRSRPARHTPYNWTTWNSTVDVRSDGVTVAMDLEPAGTVSVAGWDVFAFDLDVPGLPQAPPDYTEDPEQTVTDGQPNWQSPARVIGTARLGPLSTEA